MTHCISNPCLIEDPNITFTSFETEVINDQVYYHAKLTYNPKACPACKVAYKNFNIVKNGTRTSRIKLLKNQGKQVILVLKKQRFLCKSCQTAFTAHTDIVDPHCFISKIVKRHIAVDAAKVCSEQDISESYHVSTTTVRRVIDTIGNALKVNFHFLPKVLSFDEFKSTRSINGSMSFVIVNPLNSTVIDVVENRQLHWLKAYFYRYPLYVRKRVKRIVIDNNYPYIQLIKQLFPKAKIVLDRFHLVQALMRELNKLRIRTMNQYKHKNRPLYNKFKRYWKLILKNRKELEYSTLTSFPLFYEYTSTGRIVDYLLEQDSTFQLNYEYIHDVYDAICENDKVRLEELIVEILQSNADKGLKKVMKTFKKNQTYIKNTLTYTQLSNGPIEGINNKIKLIKRVAYGYRNYYHFRNRILIVMKFKKKKNTLAKLIETCA